MSEEGIATSGFLQTELKGAEFFVHKHGFVRVVDFMGSDADVVGAARVSYGKGTKTVNEDRGLIRYLMSHRHTTPFEMCVMKLHLKMPLFVARQWQRHRTASINEYSARYSQMKEEFFIPTMEQVKGQSITNKQGSAGELEEQVKKTFIFNCEQTAQLEYAAYEGSLEQGVSREMARINMPLSSYTEFYWQMNLHNLLHFCSLRSDPHAQKEIRDYSDIILHQIVKEWVPKTYEAFLDYVLNAKSFSAQEIVLLRNLANPTGLTSHYTETPEWKSMSKREQDEFQKKVF